MVRALLSPMKRAWAATKLSAIATLVVILATAPVSAFEVRPDKNLTGGSVRTGDRDAACGHARENRGPQPRRSIEETWNAEAKDRLERLMCNMVCDRQIDIATA